MKAQAADMGAGGRQVLVEDTKVYPALQPDTVINKKPLPPVAGRVAEFDPADPTPTPAT